MQQVKRLLIKRLNQLLLKQLSFDITAKEIMIPKVDMVTIQIDEDTDEIIKIIESGHSRYPVLGNERNEVVGIPLLKIFCQSYLREIRILILVKC